MYLNTKDIGNRYFEIFVIFFCFLLSSLFVISPIYYVFKGAFEPLSISLVSRSKDWTFDNFIYIFNEGYHTYIINSFIVCIVSTLIACVVALFAAYAISRFRFKGRGIIFGSILGGQFFPWIILINPIFIIFARAGFDNSLSSIIFIFTAVITPFSIYLLVGYLTTIPISLDEAAILDGASRFKIVIFVILPLVYPGLVATATYGFLVPWSEYILARTLLTDDSVKTLPLSLAQFLVMKLFNVGL